MQRISGFVVLALAAAAFAAEGDKDKGTMVSLDGVKSRTPGDWKEETPSNRMRYAQFSLAKKGDDKEDAELVIFKGLGGGSKANIDRWKGQFEPPEGKKIDDVAVVKEIKIGDRPASYLDIRGTFLSKFPPFDPRAKTVKKPNYRMVAIYFDGEKDHYQIKLTGPAKTVEAYKAGFDEWLKNFK